MAGKNGSGAKGFFGLFLSVTIIAAALVGGSRVSKAVSGVAVAAAAVNMPEGAYSYFSSVGISENTDTNIPYLSSKNEENNTEAVETVKKTAPVFETPADVIGMAEEYSKTYTEKDKGGDIAEMFYSAKNSNVSYGNVFVKNTTSSHSLNIKDVLSKKPDLKIADKNKPSVLIFHTHTTESYELADNNWYTSKYATRSKNPDRNMVRVGDEIEKQLVAAGFSVIHDKTVHDLKYNGAYARSRETVEKILKDNPTIQVVLDVHRDAIYQQNGTRVRPVANIENRKCAQVMIITGCEDGDVENFPDWEKNLCFALHLQNTLEDSCKGLTRPVMFCNRKYNMDLTPCSLLIEFGSDSNTLEQALYAGNLFGRGLAKMLEEYTA